MRTIQEIFDAVIESGLYSEEHHLYMCPALRKCNVWKIITNDEYILAYRSIREFMRSIWPEATMIHSLAEVIDLAIDIPPINNWAFFPTAMKIYKNWDYRFNTLNQIKEGNANASNG